MCVRVCLGCTVRHKLFNSYLLEKFYCETRRWFTFFYCYCCIVCIETFLMLIWASIELRTKNKVTLELNEANKSERKKHKHKIKYTHIRLIQSILSERRFSAIAIGCSHHIIFLYNFCLVCKSDVCELPCYMVSSCQWRRILSACN